VQNSPGAVQMPQLSLQHTWSDAHVVGPHAIGVHILLLQDSPGAAQMPQLSLQHTWPDAHVFAPH